MPLTRTQSVLRKLLPRKLFRLLYNITSGIYLTCFKSFDGLYDFSIHIFVLLPDKGDIKTEMTFHGCGGCNFIKR